MLFPHRRKQVIVLRRPGLATFMKRLNVLCNSRGVHPLPISMLYIAESTSHQGEPMAVYACSFPGCRCRQGWVQDRYTGRPRLLWSGLHDGR